MKKAIVAACLWLVALAIPCVAADEAADITPVDVTGIGGIYCCVKETCVVTRHEEDCTKIDGNMVKRCPRV